MNKYKDKDYHKKYYSRNKEKYFGDQKKRILGCSKQTALKKGLEHTLCEEDIVIPEKCPLLDIPLTNILGKGRIDSNASIDRIDCSKGYVKGNVQIISDLANRMKNSATPEQLVTFAKNILGTLPLSTQVTPS